ncbi:hypothetical protein GOP47_0021848 [Adiantum capillus-veneris]|uniref:Uncharacterized protein n=1 Tax=Adiantum capillus-veneris TaxID=13818 RepID=A0A9D4UAB2_ADICA|nr:hypothetical protein GOP47_0021848 [Adiantum capillus-veneris]
MDPPSDSTEVPCSHAKLCVCHTYMRERERRQMRRPASSVLRVLRAFCSRTLLPARPWSKRLRAVLWRGGVLEQNQLVGVGILPSVVVFGLSYRALPSLAMPYLCRHIFFDHGRGCTPASYERRTRNQLVNVSPLRALHLSGR